MSYAVFSVVFGEQPSAAKWNILGTNDASFNDGTGIADGVVKPEHLKNSSSTLNTWAWDSWTPSWTNLTLGASVLNKAVYIRTGDMLDFEIKLTIGAGFSMGAPPRFTLPFNMHGDYATNDTVESVCAYRDATDSIIRSGCLIVHDANELILQTFVASGTYLTMTGVDGAGAPFVWAASDVLWANGRVRLAA